MSIGTSSFEGKIVLLSYTECDYESEDTACLVYRVEKGKLKSLYGVMNLSDGAYWNHENKQYLKALAIIRDLGVREVYVPTHNMSTKDFFGNGLGHHNLTDELNDRGEIECWFELGTFNFCWGMMSLLKECQIKVLEIDPDTMEVVKGSG